MASVKTVSHTESYTQT